MTAAVTTPTYPIPGPQCNVVFTLAESGSNYLRVWCSVAPEGSALAGELNAAAFNRVVVYEGDAGADNPWRWTPDKGGKYTFICQEYSRLAGFGGSYDGDTRGAPSETKCGAESTVYVYVGQRLTSPIGPPQNQAKLVLYVWNDSIRPTTLALHGEITPRIDTSSASAAAKAAAETAAVAAALTALEEQTVTHVMDTVSTIAALVAGQYNAHIANAAVHNAADTDNNVPYDLYLSTAVTPAELPTLVNDILQKARRHYTNDCGGTASTNPGVGTASYHTHGGNAAGDTVNLPLYTSVADTAEAYGALGDMYRAHEAHRISTNVHVSADGTCALGAIPHLLDVHKAYLTTLASLTPTAPPAQSSGAQLLISSAGFTEE